MATPHGFRTSVPGHRLNLQNRSTLDRFNGNNNYGFPISSSSELQDTTAKIQHSPDREFDSALWGMTADGFDYDHPSRSERNLNRNNIEGLAPSSLNRRYLIGTSKEEDLEPDQQVCFQCSL